MRKLILIAVLSSITMVLAGCASRNVALEGEDSFGDSGLPLQVVAIDLVSVLGQLSDFEPWSMTVQVSPARTHYGKAVVDALSDVGYGIQKVSADQGLNHVEYKETVVIESTGNSNSFEIEIRGVRIARNYERKNDRWIPNSPIRIFGAKPSRVIVFDELHAGSNQSIRFPTGVVFHNASGDVIESRESTANLTSLVADSNNLSEADLTKRALKLSQASTFTRQRAVATDNTQTYRSVAEVVLQFPSSNPNTLGRNNKQAIAALIKNFTADSDRFVIQGCAQRKSLLWDGTESISLVRQQRVNKELIVSGVKPNSIQELGCFSDEDRTELPRQSVSVVLERLAAPLQLKEY